MSNHSNFPGILGGCLLLGGLGLVLWGSTSKSSAIVGIGVLVAVVAVVLVIAACITAALDPAGERVPEAEPVVVVPEQEAGEPPSAQLKGAIRKQLAGGYFFVVVLVWLIMPVRAIEGWIIGITATVLIAIMEEVHVSIAAKRRAKIEVVQPQTSKKLGNS